MEIYLIRHTTPHIEKGICYGQSDLDLANTYTEEFKTIKTKIPENKNYKVFSSPLKRCALLAKQFSDTVNYDNRLKELDFGDWELKAWNAISEEDMKPWMTDFVNEPVPNGESYTQLASRVHAFFEDILASESTKDLIIVTHAGPMRAYLSALLGIPLKVSFNIKINYGDIFQLKKENKVLKLITEINI
ncbi:alpha-ribazole phosphatase [Flavivirga aquatica]|uniref:Alpha-ribazole phosphatase n=1 Tax=Flavivirga aquatica TaxID=1849968 RepID=A0A1E5TBG4_9FLAO|nr:alpha-ribazole phosphatase [Flavivirga aquatica]OEK08709.1 alpha-ribazole phosphatase [Flavivirga aquatica]